MRTAKSNPRRASANKLAQGARRRTFPYPARVTLPARSSRLREFLKARRSVGGDQVAHREDGDRDAARELFRGVRHPAEFLQFLDLRQALLFELLGSEVGGVLDQRHDGVEVGGR